MDFKLNISINQESVVMLNNLAQSVINSTYNIDSIFGSSVKETIREISKMAKNIQLLILFKVELDEDKLSEFKEDVKALEELIIKNL